jgi:hypothetical protein
VAYVVADVMREGPDGKGELVCVLGIAEEKDDEVSGADVMGQVGDEGIAVGVVANVLNDGAGVSVGACVFKLLRGDIGISAAQQGHDGALPCQVDQLFMRKQRIRAGGTAEQKQAEQNSGRQGPKEMAHR